MRTWTVIGYWDESEAFAAAAVEGKLDIIVEFDCWAEHVRAKDATRAMAAGLRKHERRVFGNGD